MSRRVYPFKCEVCGLEEDIPAEDVEKFRLLKKEDEIRITLGEEFTKKDWTYCSDCGGYSWRVWNPPAIKFTGGGFTRGL